MNVIAIMLMVVPLVSLLLTSHPAAEWHAAIRVLLTFTAPS